jgi:lysophospholipase L1-like esterase
MSFSRITFLILVVAFAAGPGCSTGKVSRSEMLPGAQRVLVLGDSITHGGQYLDFIEAYLVTRFPERKIELLNLGLPSETVSGLSEPGHANGQFPRPDLHERLGRVLEMAKPDVVIACYGMNDGIYLPFADERLASFTNGLVRLRENVTALGAKMVHVTPPVFDEARGKGPGYAATLDRYADWMLAQRKAGWDVIDLHGPMKRELSERRRIDPGYFLARDGVHPGDEGHWLMAKAILSHLGARDLAEIKDPVAMLSSHPNGGEILKLVQQKQRVLRDAWLQAAGHKRPGMPKGLPIAAAEAKATELDVKIRELARAKR